MIVEKHTGTFTWYAPIELAAGVDPATLKITGKVAMQLCDPNTCVDEDYAWTASLGQGVEIPAAATESAADAAADATSLAADAKEPIVLSTLLVQLGFAFLGGLILNLMPCVLPVISLKILSFLRTGRREPRPGVRLERSGTPRAALGVHGAGRVGGRRRAWPGANNSRCRGSKWP